MPKKKPAFLHPTLDKIAAAQKVMDDVTAELKSNKNAKMAELFLEVLTKHPQVHAFQWVQYTPSFNDGDPCTFTRGDVECSLPENPEEFEDAYALSKEDQRAVMGAVEDFEGVLDALGDDVLERVFGNGEKITVSREGIETEDYYAEY